MIYFIGIGGIGMSALARYFLSCGEKVAGSDVEASRIIKLLAREGAVIHAGRHSARNVPRDARLIIISQAIQETNPELKLARKRGLPVLSYPEAISELTKRYKTIAIAGAHGKSTTTALTALILINGGLDPTVIVGTNLKEFDGTNFRAGRGSYLVLEADEFGRAFLRYSPSMALITNIDREHLDIYKNLSNVKTAFLQFLKKVRPDGILVLNKDDKNLASLRPRIRDIAEKNHLAIRWYSLRDPSTRRIKTILKIAGVHNLSNAAGAYALGKALEIPDAKILKTLGEYRGASRRMEYRGSFEGRLVFDDYAHHPTEIKATLRAFREKYKKKSLICVFQPHQMRRLKELFSDFTAAFHDADMVFILPIYKVMGRDEKKTVNSSMLARMIREREPKKPVFYVSDAKSIKKWLNNVPSSSIIVMMGAGDIVKLTDSLVS